MKGILSRISLFAALAGILSFTFLVVALVTDFWYLIDASQLQNFSNHTVSLSSHSGLWRTCQFNRACFSLENPFKPKTANITTSHKKLLYMRASSVVLLPLSLLFIISGGMVGVAGILTQAFCLLLLTGGLFLQGALFTLIGVIIYIAYSSAAFKKAISLLGWKNLSKMLKIQFGWSLAFAWVSIVAAVLAGLAFLLMARMARQKRRWGNFI